MDNEKNLNNEEKVQKELKRILPKIKTNAVKKEPKHYANKLKDELGENLILLNYFAELGKIKIKDILTEEFGEEIADKIAESIRNGYLKNKDRVKLMIRRLNGESLTKEEQENACFPKQGRQPKFKINSDKKSDVKEEEEETKTVKNNSSESNKKFEASETDKKPIATLEKNVEELILELKGELEEKVKEILEKDSKINSLEIQVEELEKRLAISSSISEETISKEISLDISSFLKIQEKKHDLKGNKVKVEVYYPLMKSISKFINQNNLVDTEVFLDEDEIPELSPNSKILQTFLIAVLNKYKFLKL